MSHINPETFASISARLVLSPPFDPPAPEGYELREQCTCIGCAAYRADDDDLCNRMPPCMSRYRPDRRNVIFIRKV